MVSTWIGGTGVDREGYLCLRNDDVLEGMESRTHLNMRPQIRHMSEVLVSNDLLGSVGGFRTRWFEGKFGKKCLRNDSPRSNLPQNENVQIKYTKPNHLQLDPTLLLFHSKAMASILRMLGDFPKVRDFVELP